MFQHLFLGDQEQLEVDPDKRTVVLSADFEPRILLDYAVVSYILAIFNFFILSLYILSYKY